MTSVTNCLIRMGIFLLAFVIVSGCNVPLPAGDGTELSTQSEYEIEQKKQMEASSTPNQADADDAGAKSPDAVEDTGQEIEQAVTEDDTNAENESKVAASGEGATTPPIGRVSEDFTLVGSTGRPQFVYTFADW